MCTIDKTRLEVSYCFFNMNLSHTASNDIRAFCDSRNGPIMCVSDRTFTFVTVLYTDDSNLNAMTIIITLTFNNYTTEIIPILAVT